MTGLRDVILIGAPAGAAVTDLVPLLADLGRFVVIGPGAGAGSVPSFDADLGSWSATSEAVASAEARWGPVEALITLPAPAPASPIEDVDDVLWEATLADHLTAPMHLARAACPAMAERGRGCIVPVTWSIEDGRKFVHLAATSEAAMLFAKALAAEVGPGGIRVNAVAVPPGEVAAAAPAIRLLLSGSAGYLTGEVLRPAASEQLHG